jgi:hypothetical protein
MDALKEIRPNTLAITLRVSELEEIINRQVTQAFQSTPLWHLDLNKRQLLAVLAELSPEQTEQVLTFAVDLLVKASQPEESEPISENQPALVDTREADNEAQATIGLALSSLINGNKIEDVVRETNQEDAETVPESEDSSDETARLTATSNPSDI